MSDDYEPTRKQSLVNHICLGIKELAQLIAILQIYDDITDEQVIDRINAIADQLRIGDDYFGDNEEE